MLVRPRAVLSTRTAPSGDPGQPATPTVVPATGSGGGNPGVGQPIAGPGSAPPEVSFAAMNAAAAAQAGGIAPAVPQTPAPAQSQYQFVPPGQPAPVPAAPPATPAAPPPVPALTAEQVAEYQQLRSEWGNIQTFVRQAQAERAQLLARANQQPAPAAPAAQPQTNAFGVPQWDRSLERYLTVDPQTRQVSELPGAPAGTLQRYHEYRHKAAEFQERFAADPEGALAPVLGKLKEQARQEAESVIRQQQEQQVVNSFISDNRTWLYQRGPDGNVATDWQGNPQLSPRGREFYQIAAELKTAGATNMQAVIGTAMRAVLGNAYLSQLGQQQQQPAQPQQAPVPQQPQYPAAPQYQQPQAPQYQPTLPPGVAGFVTGQGAQPQAPPPQYPAMPLAPAPATQGNDAYAAAQRAAFLAQQAGVVQPAVPGGVPAAGPVLPGTPEWGLPDFGALNQVYARHYGMHLTG